MVIELPADNNSDCMSISRNDSNAGNNENRSVIDEREESIELLSNMRKGFFIETVSRDGRKKLFNEVEIQSESIVNSHTDREICTLEDAFCNY